METVMKKLPMSLVLVAASVFGAQSVTPSGPFTLSVTLPYAPWTTISATQPMRWEFRIHNFGSDMPLGGAGFARLGGEVYIYSLGPNTGYLGVRNIDNNVQMTLACCASRTDILMRVQRDPANGRYTWEVWNTAGGGYAYNTRAATFTSYNWAGDQFSINSGQMAFMRWFSSTVPLGTSVPIAGVTGDLGDWEFEGNLRDSSGHGLNMSDSLATYSTTPVYPPVCNAGQPTSFRAGSSQQLDGTASLPLDGGVGLSYVWQQLAGPTITWSREVLLGRTIVSSQKDSQPKIEGLLAGSYTFQLTVKDSSGQSSVCTVNAGAVATDDHDVVITNLPQVDTLLGPMVRFGANPWPWFDNRHQAEANMQIANMDTYYGAYWNVADAGTVTVTTRSTAVTGSGTTFTRTFCQGPGSPTVPKNGAQIIVWYPNGDAAGDTGRREIGIASCTSDTALTMTSVWAADVAAGSGLSYSDNANEGTWAWNNAPANYYDNVAAFYALYYRSGIVDYLNAARKLADRFWTCPQMDRGHTYTVSGGSTNNNEFPERSRSFLGLILRALDGRSDMWAGLNAYYYSSINYELPYYAQFGPGLYDGRDEAYMLAELSYCALYDTDATWKSNCKTAVSAALTSIWTPSHFADGGWQQMFYSSSSWSTSSSVALVHGSTTVTGTNTSWNSGDDQGLIWFTNSTGQPTSNAGGDPTTYTATYVDATHLTLNTAYEGTTGTHGWAISDRSYLPVVGYGQQPYAEGLISFAFDMASQAIADSDPIGSATYRSYNVDAANWVRTYGYRPATKGMFYFAQFVNCQYPISDSNTACTTGYTTAQSRMLGMETERGMAAAYKYNGDASLKAFVDTLYNAQWAKPTTCPSGSTICVPDGSYVSDYDDGGWNMSGTPPIGDAPKYFGQAFGVSALSAWPGYRLGEQ
jgi:hypothetical protein